MSTLRLISNSEVSSWLSCKRKYYFEYMLNLEPKQFSDPINKGITIHSVLENYYAAKALGLSEEDSRQEGLSVLASAMSMDNADIQELGRLHTLMGAYFDYWQLEDDARYKVYAVETKLKMDITDSFALVGTIDLVWLDTEQDKYYLVDHKSSYNFWSDEQAEFSGQFVKYVMLGRNHGLDIGGVIVNQVRTRELKPGNDLFKRLYVRPTEQKIATVARQHINASQEIVGYRENVPVDDYIPVMDKFVCSNCSFKSICDTMNNGGDIKYGIQQDFKTRTGYGYN